MNKYEQLINKLLKGNVNWKVARPIPRVLDKYGDVQQIYGTKLTDEMTLYLYTYMSKEYNAELDEYYKVEKIGCSCFIQDREVIFFDDSNVPMLWLQNLLNEAQNSVFHVDEELDKFLNYN